MGLLWTVFLNLPLWLGAYWFASHALGKRRALDGFLATSIIGWAWITFATEILGSFGLLARGPLLGWSLLGLAIGFVSRLRDKGRSPDSDPELGSFRESRWKLDGVLLLGFAIWGSLTLLVPALIMPVKVVSDGPIYHLYFAARWWKAGSLILVATPFGENAATYFPANGDLWFTWFMVGSGADIFAKLGQFPFLIVSAAATYGMARRLGASGNPSLIATIQFLTCTPLIFFGFEPNVDTIFIAGYLTACYFTLDLVGESGIASSLGVAALSAGLAWGTKATGTVFLPPLLLGLWLLASRRISWWKSLVIIMLGVLSGCGYWFARFALLTGNPLYPLQVKLFGFTVLQGWYDSDVMKLSKYYIPVSEWRAAVDQLLAVLDPRLAPFWILAVGFGMFVGMRKDRRVGTITAMVVLNIALYWLAIPYRTQQRFMFHALGLAVVPTALLMEKRRWLQVLIAGLCILHICTGQAWPFARTPGASPPWDLTPNVPNGVSGILNVGSAGRGLFLVAGVASFFLGWLWAFVQRKRTKKLVLMAIGSSFGVVSLLAALQISIAPATILPFPPFIDYYAGWLDLEGRSGPSGLRVAYAGTNLPYYLMGRDFRNQVFYVNIDGHRDWLLHDYHREAILAGKPNWPHPRPGWDRIRPDYDAWIANVMDLGIQVLVVARADPEEGVHNLYDPQGFTIERAWADAHPETFVPLYGAVQNDPRFRTYRVIGSKR